MNTLVKNIIRFVFFILVQVFVLDKIHLHQMVTPYIYFLLFYGFHSGWGAHSRC